MCIDCFCVRQKYILNPVLKSLKVCMWSDITPFTAANSGRSTVSDRRIFVFNDHLDLLNCFTLVSFLNFNLCNYLFSNTYLRWEWKCVLCALEESYFRGLRECVCDIWNELNSSSYQTIQHLKCVTQCCFRRRTNQRRIY